MCQFCESGGILGGGVWGSAWFLLRACLFLSPCPDMEEERYECESEWSDGLWRSTDVMYTPRIPISPPSPSRVVPSPVVTGERVPSPPSSPSSPSFPTLWIMRRDCRGLHYTQDFDAGCFPRIFPSRPYRSPPGSPLLRSGPSVVKRPCRHSFD